jgi:hypothetical protein
LLDYNEIYLSEGPWPGKAYYDAARLDESRRKSSRLLNYIVSWPLPISRGAYDQRILPSEDGDVSPNPPPAEPLPAVPDPPSATEAIRPEAAIDSSANRTGVLTNTQFDPTQIESMPERQ